MMTMTRPPLLPVLLALCFAQSTIVSAQAQDTVIYYHADAIGSVRVITNVTGQVVARYDYLPFGEAWAPPPNSDVRQFAGKERDAETGFDYFGARYYATGLGRFTTTDSAMALADAVENPQRWNRYAYVSNNPLRKIDPNGLWERDVHYHLTRTLAIAAGFNSREADRIGFWTQNVDDDPATSPMGRGLWGEPVRIREQFHFVDGERRGELWREYMSSHSLQDLGYMLHATQDQYAHAGFGPRIGHTLALKFPDMTWVLPSRANAMARDTYATLLTAGQDPSRAYVPWRVIEPFVTRFNNASTERAKMDILDEMGDAIAGYFGGHR